MRSRRLGLGLVGLFLAVGLFSLEASAEARCRTFRGWFFSEAAPDGCQGALCTKGVLYGGLNGQYALTVQQMFPTGDPEIPTVFFYTGKSHITLRFGDLIGTDAGSLNLDPASGKFTALITLTEGSGRYTGATGHLIVKGTTDMTTGLTAGDYEGEYCTP